MAISIECDDCGKNYKVRDEAVGQRFKCKNCGTPIRVPEQQDEFDDSFHDGLAEMEAEASAFDNAEMLPQAVRREKKAKSKSPNQAKKKRRPSKNSVANGLRCVLAGLLLHFVAVLSGFVPYGLLIALPLTLLAPILAIIGQAMCLKAPEESKTRILIYGVLGLQCLAYGLSLASFLPIVSLLALVASYFLFIYALKRLSEFIGSAEGEMHAEWILYSGARLAALIFGSLVLGALLGPLFGLLFFIVTIATVVISFMILLRYVDLLGCLKDKLDNA
ncbi:MAG: hypothetical protein JKY95_10685 [Planctomycetaceae bacterium]|nr:hypothetical protein [Planctomycetaceae bacterium]